MEPMDTGEGSPDVSPVDERAADFSPLEKLQRERDDYYNRLLRKTAEFDNFRKRVDRDRREMAEWAGADILTEVVSVMDDFERALAAPAPPEAKPYKAGVELIHKQLNEFLKKRGVTKSTRSAPTSTRTCIRRWPTKKCQERAKARSSA